MYDGFGIAPYTFFNLLMCAALFYWDLRQFRFCRLLCRGSSSPEDLQYSGYYQKVDRNRYVLFTGTFKRITNTGSMMRFPVHKGYYGKPTHHTGVSNLKWLLISKLLNPDRQICQPRRSGPNYYLPSPRRASFFTSAANHTPLAAAIHTPFLSRHRSSVYRSLSYPRTSYHTLRRLST